MYIYGKVWIVAHPVVVSAICQCSFWFRGYRWQVWHLEGIVYVILQNSWGGEGGRRGRGARLGKCGVNVGVKDPWGPHTFYKQLQAFEDMFANLDKLLPTKVVKKENLSSFHFKCFALECGRAWHVCSVFHISQWGMRYTSKQCCTIEFCEWYWSLSLQLCWPFYTKPSLCLSPPPYLIPCCSTLQYMKWLKSSLCGSFSW